MRDTGSGGAGLSPTGVAWRRMRDAAVIAVGRGWPVVPGTCRPDELGFSQVCPLQVDRSRSCRQSVIGRR